MERTVSFVITILLLVCVTGGLYYRARGDNQVDNFNALWQPLIASHDVYALAKAMSQLNEPRLISAVESIVTDPDSELTGKEKVQLFILLGYYFRRDKSMVQSIFDRMYAQRDLITNYPPFLIAAQTQYPVVINDISAWLKKTHQNTTMHEWVQSALSNAVDENSEVSLEVLYAHNIRPNQSQANKLLKRVVLEGKRSAFVQFLVGLCKANVHQIVDKKYTLLMLAVKRDNIRMVRALIDVGADINAMIDPATGTALQVAMINGFTDIEKKLRKMGATRYDGVRPPMHKAPVTFESPVIKGAQKSHNKARVSSGIDKVAPRVESVKVGR